MADAGALIEALELRFMQSWMHRDGAAIRSMASRDFMIIVGTKPPELLDRPSFVAAIESDFRCDGFRLDAGLVRRHGKTASYYAGAQLELQLARHDWSGYFLISDVWKKMRFGGWKIVERSLAPCSNDKDLTEAMRQLQLWK